MCSPHNAEFASPVPAEKAFNAHILHGEKLIPKILPQVIKNIERLEGDGQPGTITLMKFGEGSEYKNAKQRLDKVDMDNYSYSISIIGGEPFIDGVESISYVTKFEPKADGGSICKISSSYHPIAGAQVNEEEIKVAEGNTLAVYQAVDAYLQANPDAVN